MADDQDQSQKTEDATPQKLLDARKKGDVAKSQEIPSWLMLASITLLLAAFSGPTARYFSNWLRSYFELASQFVITGASVQSLAVDASQRILLGLGMVLAMLIVAGLSGHVLQVGLLWAPDKVSPKLSKLSPIEGAKRIFGMQAIANFFKGLAKMGLVGIAAFAVVWPRRETLVSLPYLDLEALFPVIREASVSLMLAALSVFTLVAIADYAFQRQSFLKRMRMSHKDVKDELKNTEGDPHVRARLRQIRAERSRQRMMQAVPEASVVIMNPTHYAVALRYEQGESVAPVCVAKGMDDLALRIRDVAEEANVPVVVDPPLARALFATTEVDHEIKTEHFKAVAKVIGYVMGLAERRRR
ncbi:MAG: flagellar biosynthesis protein FlhB [Robiginitomaculum sp.]|nr:flagellar biosynthesis protein FlhB [Robiginitomaculum sp.]MDQ7077342.1 flagellar biosynthesis protein FlhB [Robiginitomaculum sp.]